VDISWQHALALPLLALPRTSKKKKKKKKKKNKRKRKRTADWGFLLMLDHRAAAGAALVGSPFSST
jgi:hypothetical protein